jgi:hypothetical protein
MTEKGKPRSESLLSEIRDLTNKVREVRLELEELVKRPTHRSPWRMMSSHEERSHSNDHPRRSRAAERPPPSDERPAADPDHSALEPDPDRDDTADR